MGTRHIIIAKIDGKNKIAQYGQWDGYFEGQGVNILEKLKRMDLKEFKSKLRKTRFVKNEKERCDLILEKSGVNVHGRDFISIGEGDVIGEYAPEFSRDTSAEILDLVYEGKAQVLVDSSGSEENRLFCEYFYIIDLDEKKLKSFKNVFFGESDDGEYLGDEVKMEHSLNNLPTEEKYLEDGEKVREEAEELHQKYRV